MRMSRHEKIVEIKKRDKLRRLAIFIKTLVKIENLIQPVALCVRIVAQIFLEKAIVAAAADAKNSQLAESQPPASVERRRRLQTRAKVRKRRRPSKRPAKP